MTEKDDDAIVIDLTPPYEADWMARGRKRGEDRLLTEADKYTENGGTYDR